MLKKKKAKEETNPTIQINFQYYDFQVITYLIKGIRKLLFQNKKTRDR